MKQKIIDCFTFFNELDMLEFRLTELDPYVDKFVIIESTKTFTGEPKPLYYNLNKFKYKQWSHKIVHKIVYDMPIDLKQEEIDNVFNLEEKNKYNTVYNLVLIVMFINIFLRSYFKSVCFGFS